MTKQNVPPRSPSSAVLKQIGQYPSTANEGLWVKRFGLFISRPRRVHLRLVKVIITRKPKVLYMGMKLLSVGRDLFRRVAEALEAHRCKPWVAN